MEKNDIVLLFTSNGTGLPPKTRKKLGWVKNETPCCTRVPTDIIAESVLSEHAFRSEQ